jgi:hypothetical protein
MHDPIVTQFLWSALSGDPEGSTVGENDIGEANLPAPFEFEGLPIEAAKVLALRREEADASRSIHHPDGVTCVASPSELPGRHELARRDTPAADDTYELTACVINSELVVVRLHDPDASVGERQESIHAGQVLVSNIHRANANVLDELPGGQGRRVGGTCSVACGKPSGTTNRDTDVSQ